MVKLTKEQRAEIFQFLYELHQKLWGEFIELVKSGVVMDLYAIKNEIVCEKYRIMILANCLGCECNNDPYEVWDDCCCFLNLDCCNRANSLWKTLNKKMYLDITDIPIMRKIQNCGWRDNGLSDSELIKVLLEL